MHVCTLSMSPLTTVRADLKAAEKKFGLLSEEERLKDELLCCSVMRLRWTELSMEYNRNIQLKYVYSQLGDKGTNPKFRQLKVRSVFAAWKRELLRQKWLDVRKVLDSNSIGKRMNKKMETFKEQRSLLAGRSLAGLSFVNQPPIADLVPFDDPIESLFAFRIPSTLQIMPNQDHEYLESSAVKTISEVPTEDDSIEAIDESIKQRLRQRGLNLQDDIIEERKKKEEEERIVEQARRREEEKKNQKKDYTIPIIIVLVLLLIVGIFVFTKVKQEHARKLAEEACKNAQAKKKGWFGK